MNRDELTDAILVAFVDGQLSEEESVEIRQMAENNPDLLGKVEMFTTTGSTLKKEFAVESAITAPHIESRIRDIARKTRLGKGTAPPDTLAARVLNAISWKYLTSMGLSLVTGVALSFLVLVPAPTFYQAPQQSVLRGLETCKANFISTQITQGDSVVCDGGTLKPNLRSNLILMLPISGNLELFEIRNGLETPVLSEPNVIAGNRLTIPMKVYNQATLSFKIQINNGTSHISHTITFNIAD
ncbi:MAG: hypothetical protein HOK41_05480 [Nitrospina sp.]|jgi:hypothetical protein|nr:hypothetical protein [Nitrospina sp.]